jgi:hypothetical protein
MSISTTPPIRKSLLSLRVAKWCILLLWLVYTLLYNLHPSDTLASVLEFVPGALAVGILVMSGFSLQKCYLRRAAISWPGLGLLAVSLLFMPFIWLTGRWTGWNWMDALLYAPASGISQELFFRAALLPILTASFKTKPFRAVVIQSVLFALWHVPKAYLTAPLGGTIGVIIVTFVCGILWGKQVQRDGTVIWLAGYHSLLLISNSFFTWG